MGKIIKVSSHVHKSELESIAEKASKLEEEVLVVVDSEMEVFEYNELENVTIHKDEVAEMIEEAKNNNVIEGDTLYHGME